MMLVALWWKTKRDDKIIKQDITLYFFFFISLLVNLIHFKTLVNFARLNSNFGCFAVKRGYFFTFFPLYVCNHWKLKPRELYRVRITYRKYLVSEKVKSAGDEKKKKKKQGWENGIAESWAFGKIIKYQVGISTILRLLIGKLKRTTPLPEKLNRSIRSKPKSYSTPDSQSSDYPSRP